VRRSGRNALEEVPRYEIYTGVCGHRRKNVIEVEEGD
jgi:hypothetical protein